MLCASFTGSDKKLGADAVLVSKSTDGGLSWGAPVTLIDNKTTSRFHDKPSLTADPTDSGRVYAVWTQFTGNQGVQAEGQLARTTDSGQTWAVPQSIDDSHAADSNAGDQIVVRPDGTLLDTFTEFLFSGQSYSGEISAVRSTDHGLTWGPRITVAQVPPGLLTDPDTG